MFRALVAFVRLGRPLFLGGGFVGFALGVAAARFDGAAIALIPYLWAQVLVSAFHVMVHYANEFYDQAGDALSARTLFSGGSGVLVRGELPPRVASVAAAAFGALGSVLVLRAALGGELVLAAVGVAIGVLSWAYSAPPLRLLARGLGEADTVAVVGLLVPLAGYAAFAHAVGPHVLWAAFPGVCAMFAMMLCVEVPDVAADAASGKRNLVVRWGVGRAITVARAACAIAICGLCAVLVAVFGVVLATAVAFASIPALIAATLTAPRAPGWGVAFYAAIGLAGLVAIANA
jgi:1,4-dihydroxy-2-naphthoate octaprenyltransferase